MKITILKGFDVFQSIFKEESELFDDDFYKMLKKKLVDKSDKELHNENEQKSGHSEEDLSKIREIARSLRQEIEEDILKICEIANSLRQEVEEDLSKICEISTSQRLVAESNIIPQGDDFGQSEKFKEESELGPYICEAYLDKLESSDEELESSDEELKSSDEELESSDEELESSDEELGSSDEEHNEELNSSYESGIALNYICEGFIINEEIESSFEDEPSDSGNSSPIESSSESENDENS